MISIIIGYISLILHIIAGIHVYGLVMHMLTKENTKLPFDTWHKDRWTALVLAVFIPIPTTVFYSMEKSVHEFEYEYIFKFFKPKKDGIQRQICDDTYLFNIWTHPQLNIALEVKRYWERTHEKTKFIALHGDDFG